MSYSDTNGTSGRCAAAISVVLCANTFLRVNGGITFFYILLFLTTDGLVTEKL